MTVQRRLCSVDSGARQEPLLGTASTVARWLLVEQPGPWGPAAPPQSRLDPRVAASLQRLARDAGARLLLLRRPHGRSTTERSVFLCDVRAGTVLARTVPDARSLSRLTLPDDDPAHWVPRTEPLFLVCTHGRHDTCCAVRGRPVVAAMAEHEEEATWECSHIGGDRFAANVLVLPAGLYLGRVDAADVLQVSSTVRAGRVPVPWLRGRCIHSPVTQAAQVFAAQATGRDRLGDLRPVGQEELGDGRWRVLLDDVEVVLERGSAPAQLLTCGSTQPQRAPTYRLVGVTERGVTST